MVVVYRCTIRTIPYPGSLAVSSGLSSPGVSFSSRILAAANKWICDCSLSWSQLLHKSSQCRLVSASQNRIKESGARSFRTNGISPQQLARQAKINSIDNADANHHTKTTWFLKDPSLHAGRHRTTVSIEGIIWLYRFYRPHFSALNGSKVMTFVPASSGLPLQSPGPCRPSKAHQKWPEGNT